METLTFDTNIVEQTPDDDDDVSYVRYIPPPPEVPVPAPIHPTQKTYTKTKADKRTKRKV